MNKLLIANWKMQITHKEAKEWLTMHLNDIEKALTYTKNRLVICPSFTELSYTASLPVNTIAWGAQDCSPVERGAFTGDVSIISLTQLDCSYVLVGHSDRRTYYADSDERIQKKTALALKYGLLPIVCIGETTEQRDSGITWQALEKQLLSVIDLFNTMNSPSMLIAYEPVWAIGKGVIATKDEISSTCQNIQQLVREKTAASCKILYGGSVDEQTINQIPLDLLDGLLLGKASTDAQVLKKIILSC